MQLFNIAAANSEISHARTISHVHNDSIRELAVQGGQTGLVASGGETTSDAVATCHRCFFSPIRVFPQVSMALSASHPSTMLKM